MNRIESFTRLLGGPRDGALLRYSLGVELLKADDVQGAALHLRQAVERDRDYSAAWKALGQALARCGRNDDALTAYRQGIEVATRKGDVQAAREMKVFVRRLERAAAPR